jgi:hypothetical protein
MTGDEAEELVELVGSDDPIVGRAVSVLGGVLDDMDGSVHLCEPVIRSVDIQLGMNESPTHLLSLADSTTVFSSSSLSSSEDAAPFKNLFARVYKGQSGEAS